MLKMNRFIKKTHLLFLIFKIKLIYKIIKILIKILNLYIYDFFSFICAFKAKNNLIRV
jgi:hypothetical protein